MFVRVSVLTFSHQDADILEEGVNCFAGFRFYGTQFVSGAPKVTSWCHIIFKFCPVCAEFLLLVG